MSAPKPNRQLCEVCHEREATAAAVLSFGKGPNINIGHPKLFMIGKASGASFMAAANVE
jgi:hypothetical protein